MRRQHGGFKQNLAFAVRHREAPWAPPQHPWVGRNLPPGTLSARCLAVHSFIGWQAPLSLSAREVPEKGRPVILQTFSKLLCKIFFLFFCLPRCAFAFTLPESPFSSLPLAQTQLEHFIGILPRVTYDILLCWPGFDLGRSVLGGATTWSKTSVSCLEALSVLPASARPRRAARVGRGWRAVGASLQRPLLLPPTLSPTDPIPLRFSPSDHKRMKDLT